MRSLKHAPKRRYAMYVTEGFGKHGLHVKLKTIILHILHVTRWLIQLNHFGVLLFVLNVSYKMIEQHWIPLFMHILGKICIGYATFQMLLPIYGRAANVSFEFWWAQMTNEPIHKGNIYFIQDISNAQISWLINHTHLHLRDITVAMAIW